jgi:hypothetical protein
MGYRITEVNQQPIAQILCYMALKATDDPSTDLLILLHYLPQLLRIELL